MKTHKLAVIACAVLPFASLAAPVSHFPKKDIGRFLAENFDVATIRSSLGPMRTPQKRTFAALGIKPSKHGENGVEFASDTWHYEMRVLRRADINSDGIEDLEACFTDRAIGATYNAQQALLITRYSKKELAIALSFKVDGCEEFAK